MAYFGSGIRWQPAGQVPNLKINSRDRAHPPGVDSVKLSKQSGGYR